MLNLKQDYFTLLSLPRRYDIDREALTRHYHRLQQTVHPDRFASASAQEKRYSMQAASLINQAYQTLRSDIDRASYLLSLQGITLNTETDTHVDTDFLMLQMEYRESLQQLGEQPDPLEAAEQLRNTLRRDEQALQSEVAAALAEQQWQAARDGIRKWQFFAKLQADLNAIEQQFEDD